MGIHITSKAVGIKQPTSNKFEGGSVSADPQSSRPIGVIRKLVFWLTKFAFRFWLENAQARLVFSTMVDGVPWLFLW